MYIIYCVCVAGGGGPRGAVPAGRGGEAAAAGEAGGDGGQGAGSPGPHRGSAGGQRLYQREAVRTTRWREIYTIYTYTYCALILACIQLAAGI